MKYLMSIILIACVFWLTSDAVSPTIVLAKQAKQVKASKNNTKDELLKRIDFGNSYIMGQSIKSGAVYLLQRKKSEIKSMLKYRDNYRKEILENFKVKESKSNVKQ